MKTPNQTIRMVLGSSLALASAVVFGLPVQTQAADPPKPAKVMMELGRIKTTNDVAALQPGDLIVMTCPKCKDVWVTHVDTFAKPAKVAESQFKPTVSMATHLCPSCETTIVRKGHGKQGKDEIVHVCKKCGSKDAFCCVLKKGSIPTKGMEEK